jgi:hypothetical protein
MMDWAVRQALLLGPEWLQKSAPALELTGTLTLEKSDRRGVKLALG